MIWDPHNPVARDSSVVSYITGEVEAVCGGTVLATPENVQEVARAVEAFLADTTVPDYVESRYLVMLASRALSSIGEGQAARKLLLFGTGLVRPSVWEVRNGASMWVLDLQQMTVRSDPVLEMVFFNSMNVVLDTVADIWDETQGRGALGLRNVCAVARAMLGDRPAKGGFADVGREIKDSCEHKLGRLAELRAWTERPQVMILDL